MCVKCRASKVQSARLPNDGGDGAGHLAGKARDPRIAPAWLARGSAIGPKQTSAILNDAGTVLSCGLGTRRCSRLRPHRP